MVSFDAAAWTLNLEAVGGAAIIDHDGKLWFGTSDIDGDSLERAMAEIVGHPERKATVRQYLIGRP